MQEHCLPKQGLSYLNSLHSDVSARGISSVDYDDGVSYRPYCGVCFYGDDHLTHSLNFRLMTMRKRLIGLNITTSNATILVLNVYLPYQSDDTVVENDVILGKIQAISDSF